MTALLATFSWQELRQHPWRNAAAVVAVMLGVALAFAVHLINASALSEFSSAVRSVNGQPDAELRAVRGGFDEALFARVAAHPGVALASPVLEVQTLLRTPDGSRKAVRVLGVDALVIAAVAPALMPVPHADADRFALFAPGTMFLNPAAQAFQSAAGDFGLRLFGVIFWAAAITSVIGAAYTSVSFLTVFTHLDERKRSFATVVFIFLSLLVYVAMGTAPAAILVFVGGFNGLILPIGLSIFTYVGFARPDLMGGHRYNRPLLIASAIVCALTWYMGWKSVGTIFAFLAA